MEKAIEIRQLWKSFGETQALKPLTLDVRKGEIFGLVGPDGAGKTTLIRMLVSLLLPSGGSAVVAGCDIIKDYGLLRGKLGYMPGQFSLYQELTVKENLDFFAGIFKTTVEKNYELIADIYEQIAPFENRRAGKLSGGMKQKLALSCALIHRPEVLFLDEPTTGVDVVSRAEFWQLLKKRRDEGMTIVVSTPYMNEAEMCDRVALIQKGEVMKTDTPQNIVSAFDKKLYAAKSSDNTLLSRYLGYFEGTLSHYRFGDKIHWIPRGGSNEKELSAFLRKKNFRDFTVEKIDAGIEDCFMDLMKEKPNGNERKG